MAALPHAFVSPDQSIPSLPGLIGLISCKPHKGPHVMSELVAYESWVLVTYNLGVLFISCKVVIYEAQEALKG